MLISLLALLLLDLGFPAVPSLCCLLVGMLTYLELARRQRRWSQQRLSKETDGIVAQHHISMFETGRGNPTPAERATLAALLGIPADRLLERVPDLVERPTVAEVEVSR